MITLTSPDDMQAGTKEMLEKALTAFESKWQGEIKGQSYYHLVIEWELLRNISDEVEKLYRSVGWKSVKCRTSSENGERPGLTGLILKTTE